jgi:hypothetical protein
MTEFISIHGARENNLKDVTLRIPKRQLTIFTGVSGSGKSSIVFGTLATEAQRAAQGRQRLRDGRTGGRPQGWRGGVRGHAGGAGEDEAFADRAVFAVALNSAHSPARESARYFFFAGFDLPLPTRFAAVAAVRASFDFATLRPGFFAFGAFSFAGASTGADVAGDRA